MKGDYLYNCFIRTNKEKWTTKHGLYKNQYPILRMPIGTYKKLLDNFGSISNFPNVKNECISYNPTKIRGQEVMDIVQEEVRIKVIRMANLNQIKDLFANENRRVGITDFTKLTYGTRYLNYPWEIYVIELENIENISRRVGECLNEVLQTS